MPPLLELLNRLMTAILQLEQAVRDKDAELAALRERLKPEVE